MNFEEAFLDELEKISGKTPPKRTFPEQVGMPWAKMSPRFGAFQGKTEKPKAEEKK